MGLQSADLGHALDEHVLDVCLLHILLEQEFIFVPIELAFPNVVLVLETLPDVVYDLDLFHRRLRPSIPVLILFHREIQLSLRLVHPEWALTLTLTQWTVPPCPFNLEFLLTHLLTQLLHLADFGVLGGIAEIFSLGLLGDGDDHVLMWLQSHHLALFILYLHLTLA